MRVSIASLVALIAAVAVGCGGGDSGEPQNPDDPATQAYIAEANARCLELAPALQQGGEDYDLGTEEGFSDFIGEVAIPELQQMFDELRGVEPPEGDEETVAAIYDEYDSALEEARARLEQGLSQIQDAESLYDDANELAVEYGLNECVQQG